MKYVAYIALGSNIGNREQHLQNAIQELQKHSNVEVALLSNIYETEPVGYTDQDAFLNLVLKIYTNLTAHELLGVTQKIENELGRKREIRWGPRTIDLDILLYNHENIVSDDLIVPHPRMFERSFVMVPLLDLDVTKQQLAKMYGIEQNEINDQREGLSLFNKPLIV